MNKKTLAALAEYLKKKQDLYEKEILRLTVKKNQIKVRRFCVQAVIKQGYADENDMEIIRKALNEL